MSLNYLCNAKRNKILCVVQYNEAAKTIALILANRNNIVQFNDDDILMVLVSVPSHLVSHEFPNRYNNWKSYDLVVLLNASLYLKIIGKLGESAVKTLQREINGCCGLIIMTNFDTNGENIALQVVNAVTQGPKGLINLPLYRVKVNELSAVALRRALKNPSHRLDRHLCDAVDAKFILDKRVNAVFTR